MSHREDLKMPRGVGLLELMLALAITAIVIMMATAYFNNAQMNNAVNSAMTNIQGLYAGFSKCQADHGGQDQTACTMSQLVSQNYIPSFYSMTPNQSNSSGSGNSGQAPDCDGQDWQSCSTSANPWGGSITVQGQTAALCSSKVTAFYTVIQMSGIPQNACQSLAGRMQKTFTSGQCIADSSCPSSSNSLQFNM